MVKPLYSSKKYVYCYEKWIKANYPPRFNPYAFLKHVARVAMKLSSFQLPENGKLEGGNIKCIQDKELQA